MTETGTVIEYYNKCWLDRFKDGHNPKSLAMHMGYFDSPDLDNERAKLRANQFLFEFMGVNPDQSASVVDLGCGVGGSCFYFLKNYPKSVITGVNISNDQLSFARELLNDSFDGAKLSLLSENYENTSLPDNAFDFVYAIESLCHADNKEQAFREAYRILKPGGTFCFMDYFEMEDQVDEHALELLEAFREGWAVHQYHSCYKTQLSSAGFSNLKERSLTLKVLPGIEASNIKAIRKIEDLNGNASGMYKMHLEACIALKKLIDLKKIDYKIIKVVK